MQQLRSNPPSPDPPSPLPPITPPAVADAIWSRRYKPYYSKRELANLNQTKDYVMGELLDKKGSLYKLYFDQSVSDLQ